MDGSLAKLTRSLGQAALGAKGPAEAFKALGVDVRKAGGEVKTAGEVMPELAEQLSKIESPAERAAVMTQILGRSGQKMATLLAEGAKGVNAYARAADELGLVISDAKLQSADAPLTEDGFTLADVLPDPDSLISMEERIDAKREAKIQAIIAPLLKPANLVVADEPPAPPKPVSALPLNDLMSDLRHAVHQGSSLTLRYEQVAALLSGKFVEWLAPLVSAELVALSNERLARA